MRRDGKIVSIDYSGSAATLSRVYLGAGLHNEAWLQELVQANPSILPVNDIEPGFGRLIAAAIEVPCSQGAIDNVFLTPDGDIIICELKLWRNPQARREVVAQCLDYVSALCDMGLDDFQKAILSGKTAFHFQSLYDIVKDIPDVLDEASFLDAISRNLSRGRILVLAVGDGIRAETETLARLFRENASAQFTFALVELAIYQNDQGYLAVPSTLAKTQMISREVLVPVLSDELKTSRANSSDTQKSFNSIPSGSISETQFYELMDSRAPNLSLAIKSLLKRLEPFGVYPEWKASLNFYRDDPAGGNPFNLGYIRKNGQFYSSTAGWFDRDQIARPYHRAIADIINGEIYKLPETDTYNWHDTYATTNGKSAPRIEDILPAHEDKLFEAMTEYLKRALSQD